MQLRLEVEALLIHRVTFVHITDSQQNKIISIMIVTNTTNFSHIKVHSVDRNKRFFI